MALTDVPIFQMLRLKMSWLDARQNQLAENIANADMPGYGAMDLERPNFAALVAQNQETAGMGDGFAASRGLPGAAVNPVRAQGWQMTPSGNDVVLEQQMMKVSETNMEYQTAVNLYRKGMNMWRMALGRDR